MITYEQLVKRPSHFLCLTGYKVKEFNKLAKKLKKKWPDFHNQQLLIRRPLEERQRKLGGGNKNKLSFEDQLLLSVIWLKRYLVYDMLGLFFDIDKSTVSRDIELMLQLLKIPISPRHRQGKPIRTLEELRQELPEIDDIIADATEQPIERPRDGRRRKSRHSGKKRAFTMKTQIAALPNGLIIHTSKSVGGRKHDYRLFKESGLPEIVPKDSKLYADRGYQGVAEDYPDLRVFTPVKCSRSKHKLTPSEQKYGKILNRIRIKAEHALAHLKQYEVLKHQYRHQLHNYNNVFRSVVNLVNFRTLSRLGPA